MPDTIFGKIGDFLGRRRPWYKLPRVLAIAPLIKIRNELREKNLHDTEEPALAKATTEPPAAALTGRTVDGSWNDTGCPMMGAAGRRFGRNFPLNHTYPDTTNLLEPNPLEVSRALLTRKDFQPATILNLHAASWIQFMVHDWFVHKMSKEKSIYINRPEGNTWVEHPMRIDATEADPAPDGSTRPPAYVNENSHWWDGSQIYGCTEEVCANLRTGVDGKLKIASDGRLLVDPETGMELTGFTDNGWIGLSMLHSLFTLEHNSICDMFKAKYPGWTDDKLYAKARLVNSALMAKIHTIEWTPAILPHPTTKLALNTNWYGIAGKDRQDLLDVLEFLEDSELVGGIVGSEADHHTAPYSLTEEFVSVYRMHALIPDELTIRSHTTGEELGKHEFPAFSAQEGRKLLEQNSFSDLFYSFGVSHPGAVRLHNYPKFLQNWTDPKNGKHKDLGAIDIVRDRERGVPRYNQFRRLLHKDPVTSFDELTDNPQWAEEMKRVYNGDIEKVDLMVGLFAEPLPEGFGFSETAFRVFILMASRRLKSDRFFTDDYRPEIYTQEGLDYIDANGFASVLKRHVPGLEAALGGVENPFAPWKIAAGQPLTRAAGEPG